MLLLQCWVSVHRAINFRLLRFCRPSILFRKYHMKFNSKKLNGTLAALGMVTALLTCSQMAVASSYQPSTVLPTVHSEGYLYTANVPVSGSPAANGKI